MRVLCLHHRVRRGGRSGQALVEFAIIAPLLFILLFGIIQFGITFGSHIGLTNAVREVARYASTAPRNSSLTNQINAVLPRSILAYSPGNTTSTTTYCWYANPGSPTTYSWRVNVQISYKHVLFVPLVGVFVDRIDGAPDNRLTTTAREEMHIEIPPLSKQPTGTQCSPP